MKVFACLVLSALLQLAPCSASYLPLDGCAVEEGKTLAGPFRECDLLCCQEKCDKHAECNSVSIFGVAKICYLKDRCVSSTDEVKINKYTTWYKPCDGKADRGSDPRFQSAIDVDETASVQEILKQIHAYCVEELYTDKWKSKSGALMGSKTVKQNMEDPQSTHCSNAQWRQSISKLDLQDSSFDDLFKYEDPCQAHKVYHYVMSGIGSWVSNLANVMYTHASSKPTKTISFRDERNRPSERWDLLFEHKLPLCKNFEGKSTPFVRPSPIEALKKKSVCDYAATKMFFTQKLWNVIRQGPLADDLNADVAKHVNIMRSAARGSHNEGVEFSGAYIGVHLRHKWEFKLQPPKLVDVATLVRAAAAQLNPFSHSEIAHADAQCFADDNERASVWGPAKTVVFCASDEIETCQVLQDMLGDNFFVHSIPNLKINTGRNGILSYLLDVSLLQKAALFIGSGSSNLSRMVNALRGPEKLSISMDIDFNTVHF